jgi:FAD/FMN-containing dehydrogenase
VKNFLTTISRLSKESRQLASESFKVFGGQSFSAGFALEIGAEEDLRRVLSAAALREIPVAVLGCAHSWAAPDIGMGILLFNRSPGRPSLELLEPNLVRVSGRSLWRDVEAALNAHGLTVPVLTTELCTTVGGTLSSGGYGERSFRRGGQIDLIRQLRFIKPDSEPIICSPRRNAHLFRLLPASRGAFGIIETADIMVEELPERTGVGIALFPSLEELMEAALLFLNSTRARSLDSFKGQHYRGEYIGVIASDEVDDTDVRSVIESWAKRGRTFATKEWHTRGQRSVRSFSVSNWHIWQDFVVPGENALLFAKYLDEVVVSDNVYRRYGGRILVLAIKTVRRSLFHFDPSRSLGTLTFGFGVYLDVPATDDEGAHLARQLQVHALAYCEGLGGHHYLGIASAGKKLAHPDRTHTSYNAHV